jgi:hypothetical protein
MCSASASVAAVTNRRPAISIILSITVKYTSTVTRDLLYIYIPILSGIYLFMRDREIFVIASVSLRDASVGALPLRAQKPSLAVRQRHQPDDAGPLGLRNTRVNWLTCPNGCYGEVRSSYCCGHDSDPPKEPTVSSPGLGQTTTR